MLKRAEYHNRSSLFVRIFIIYAIVLIAFLGITISAAARTDALEVNVYVQPKDGDFISLDWVHSSYNISYVKELIYKKTGIIPDKQRLFLNEFFGRELKDTDRLEDIAYDDNYNNLVLYLVEKYPYPEDPEPERHQFFRLDDDCILPATGFSSLHTAALSKQPKDLRYTSVRMRLMIPSLNVDSELVNVPKDGNSWAVEWLDDRIGILEGSAFPGKGLSVIAAHNTLNDMEYGPFSLLSTLELNELIAVSGGDNDLRTFRVFANVLLAPDNLEQMASIAEKEENTLVLITCENESADGVYLNRRVVFAKPVF